MTTITKPLPGQGSTWKEKAVEKKFWDQCLADVIWSPAFVEDFFNSDLPLHCSIEFLAVAEQYQQYYNSPKPPITFNSHIVSCNLKQGSFFLELPSVKIHESVDASPYLTIINDLGTLKKATGIDLGINKTIIRSMAYSIRLGINLAPLYEVALKYGFNLRGLDRLADRCKIKSKKVNTVDYWLIDWISRASEYCNTPGQLLILRQLYIQAAKFNTKQPRICKSTIAKKLGIDRKIIRRLFDRLIKAELMSESPETFTYDFVNRKPVSDARIVNLNVSDEPGRWVQYKIVRVINRKPNTRHTKFCACSVHKHRLHARR